MTAILARIVILRSAGGKHCDAFQGQPKVWYVLDLWRLWTNHHMARYGDAEQNMWRLRESINLVHLHLLNRIHAQISPETLNFRTTQPQSLTLS